LAFLPASGVKESTAFPLHSLESLHSFDTCSISVYSSVL
jgi:hypothetical protein